MVHCTVASPVSKYESLDLSLSLSPFFLSLPLYRSHFLFRTKSHHDTIRSGCGVEKEEEKRRANEGWNPFATRELSASSGRTD